MKNCLSVLIPIYNVDVRLMVYEIHALLYKANIGFEIRLYDDGSFENYKICNQKIALTNCTYLELEKNIGRSAIRNKLVKEALYNNVLLLDCDIKLKTENYIQKYIPFFDSNFAVSGGTEYEEKNTNEATFLHWKTGKKKEQKPYETRNKFPYRSFTLNNMLIPKSVFLAVLLDENLTTYGHEDSKFGLELEKKGIKLLHIDNSVFHVGLNDAAIFIEKSISAAKNLATLVKNEQIGVDTKNE